MTRDEELRNEIEKKRVMVDRLCNAYFACRLSELYCHDEEKTAELRDLIAALSDATWDARIHTDPEHVAYFESLLERARKLTRDADD